MSTCPALSQRIVHAARVLEWEVSVSVSVCRIPHDALVILPCSRADRSRFCVLYDLRVGLW